MIVRRITDAEIAAIKEREARFRERWKGRLEFHMNNENKLIEYSSVGLEYLLIDGVRLTLEDIAAIGSIVHDMNIAAQLEAYNREVGIDE